MSIVFSAILPHPPLILPSVGKSNADALKKTKEAFNKIEEDLYASQPDSIIIISPHGAIQENSFTMNLCPEFILNMEEFGDFSIKVNLKGDVGFAHKIRENLETKAPLQLISEPKLDYGSSLPLLLITQNMPKVKIIPIYYSGLSLDAHYQFGQLLKRELLLTKERFAVIASGDLSHRLSKKSPAGYSPKGKKFDTRLMEYLSNKDIEQILKMDVKLVHEACECGLKSIAILLGILDGIKVIPRILSYESPFGIGYLTLEYRI